MAAVSAAEHQPLMMKESTLKLLQPAAAVENVQLQLDHSWSRFYYRHVCRAPRMIAALLQIRRRQQQRNRKSHESAAAAPSV